jgi:RHS repeat-associated protein
MRQTNFTYDSYGRTASVTNASQTVQYQYDVLNRDTLTIDPLGGATRFRYTGSALTSVIDPVGKQYQYIRNLVGWVDKEIDPQGRETLYGYDAVGNVTARINHRNQLVSMAYDSLNRVLTRTADGATTSYGYDGPQGRWIAAMNAESTDTIRFDSIGRPVRTRTAMGGAVFDLVSDYAFDEAPRSSLTYSGPGYTGTIGFRYNTGLQLDRISGPAGLSDTTTIHYDKGRLTRIRLPTGLEQTFEYTPAHMLKRSRWSSSTVDNQLGWRYVWSTQDWQVSRMNAQETQWRRYDYDAGSRLRGMSNYSWQMGDLICEDPMVPSTCYRDWEWVMQDTIPYTYDAVGNRTGWTTTLESNTNRYSAFNSFSYSYDLDGNLTLKQGGGVTQSYTWNSLDQLTSVTRNGATVNYGYDGWGRRVRRTDASGVIRYVYDGDDLLLEVDGAGNRLREYLHYPGIDHPHSVRVWANGMGGARYFYASEYPGHVTGLASSAGAVANTYRYDPWGQAEATSEAVYQPLRYMARELDPLTGLYYVRNRWYDPQMQRFISEDPIGLAGGINIYAYAANSPTNLRDPSGLNPSCPTGYEMREHPFEDRFGNRQTRSVCVRSGTSTMLTGLTVQAWGFRTPRDQGWSSFPSSRGSDWILPGTGLPMPNTPSHCLFGVCTPVLNSMLNEEQAEQRAAHQARANMCTSDLVGLNYGEMLQAVQNIGESGLGMATGALVNSHSLLKISGVATAWQAGYATGKYVGRPTICATAPGFYGY